MLQQILKKQSRGLLLGLTIGILLMWVAGAATRNPAGSYELGNDGSHLFVIDTRTGELFVVLPNGWQYKGDFQSAETYCSKNPNRLYTVPR